MIYKILYDIIYYMIYNIIYVIYYIRLYSYVFAFMICINGNVGYVRGLEMNLTSVSTPRMQ